MTPPQWCGVLAAPRGLPLFSTQASGLTCSCGPSVGVVARLPVGGSGGCGCLVGRVGQALFWPVARV
eukprot:7903788-Lingulodinium_polyedra.AAC.1